MISQQLLLAQQAADNTGQTIRLIIMGLLVVALLLAMLTVWYWRHTDPRRLVRDPVAEMSQGTREAESGHATPVAAVDPRLRPSGQFPQSPPMVDDGAEEWLRLTGPQALPRSESR